MTRLTGTFNSLGILQNSKHHDNSLLQGTLSVVFIYIMSIHFYATLNGKYISLIWQVKEAESDVTWVGSQIMILKGYI